MAKKRSVFYLLIGSGLVLSLFYFSVVGLRGKFMTHEPEKEAGSKKRMDSTRVPEPLRRFIPYVQRWGAVAGDVERYHLEDQAHRDDRLMTDLRSFADQFTPEYGEIFDEWSDQAPITDCYETAKFYFALMLLYEMDLLQPDPKKLDTVENHIRNLQKFGSYRKASGRMWAARELVSHGDRARPAIPALQSALADEDPRVRVWAHYALYVLDGRETHHVDQIVHELIVTENKDLELEAIDVLRKVGTNARNAVPVIVARINSKKLTDRFRRAHLIAVLGAIGKEDALAIATLNACMQSTDDYIKQAAREAIDSMTQ